MPAHTPWGMSQDSDKIADGIVFYSTASHGGYKLSPARMTEFIIQFPDFRTFAGGSWFEEDCDAAMVPVAFPDCFPTDQVSMARDCVRSMGRHGYERFAGLDL